MQPCSFHANERCGARSVSLVTISRYAPWRLWSPSCRPHQTPRISQLGAFGKLSCFAVTPRLPSISPKSTTGIIGTLRQLAKAPPAHFEPDARRLLDAQVDRLAVDLRALTADGARATVRDLGTAIWALGKLATPSCYRHAAVLLQCLASQPAVLRSASNQTLCNALYAAALLLRNIGRAAISGDNSNNSSSSGSSDSSDSDSNSRQRNPPGAGGGGDRGDTGGGGIDGGALVINSGALHGPALVLAAACVPRLSTFTEQDVANTWWAVAVLASSSSTSSTSSPSVAYCHRPPGVGDAVLTLAAAAASGATATAAGGAAMQLPPGLLGGLAAAATRLMQRRQLGPRAAANVLWAAARLGWREEEAEEGQGLLGAAVQLLEPQIAAVACSDPRALATCLWSLAVLDHRPAAPLLAAAARPAAGSIRAFDDQALSKLLWAYGSLGVAAPRLFTAAAVEVASRCGSMSLRSLANCVWAFAATGQLQPAVPMMGAVGDALTGPAAGGQQPQQQRQQRRQQQQQQQQMLAPGQCEEKEEGQAAAGAGEAAVAVEPRQLPSSQAAAAAAAGRGSARAKGRGRDRGRGVGEARAGADAAGGRGGGGYSGGGGTGGAWRRLSLAERLAQCDGRPSQAVGNLAWSYGSLGAHHGPLQAALVGEAAARCFALTGQELANVMYAAARLLPDLAATQPAALQTLMDEVDRRLERAAATPTYRGRRHVTYGRAAPLASAAATSGAAIHWSPSTAAAAAATATADAEVVGLGGGEGGKAGCGVEAGGGEGGEAGGGAGGGGSLSPRDIAMLAWCLAVLAPASPTLRRLLAAAVAAVYATAGAAPVVQTSHDRSGRVSTAGGVAASGPPAGLVGDDDAADVEEGAARDQQQPLPYHLYGLVQLYGANYAACLADDAADRAAIVRAAAGAMRQAQQAAEAMGGPTGTGARPGPGGPTAAPISADRADAGADEDDGAGESSMRKGGSRVAAVVACGAGAPAAAVDGGVGAALFGPLAACPHLFRACRDAWHLNTVTTIDSGLQAAVGRVLRAQAQQVPPASSPPPSPAPAASLPPPSPAPAALSPPPSPAPAASSPPPSPAPAASSPPPSPAPAASSYSLAVSPAGSVPTPPSASSTTAATATAATATAGGVGCDVGRGCAADGTAGRVGGRVAAVAEEVLSPDGMFRVDLLVLYGDWLVLLQVDGPTHFAVEVGSGREANGASGGANGGGGGGGAGGRGAAPQGAAGVAAALRPLGDTLLRDWFLAASVRLLPGAVGRTAGSYGGSGSSSGGTCSSTLDAASEAGAVSGAARVSKDPWVIQSLLRQLPPDVAGPALGPAVGSGGGSRGVRVRGVALATVSHAAWNAVGEEDKWGGCLEPMLARVVGGCPP